MFDGTTVIVAILRAEAPPVLVPEASCFRQKTRKPETAVSQSRILCDSRVQARGPSCESQHGLPGSD